MKSAQAYVQAAVRRISNGPVEKEFDDVLAAEEPLEIRLRLPNDPKHRAISITMRTPGHDFELAAGFLFTEGILNHPDQIQTIRHCGLSSRNKDLRNTVVVEIAEHVTVDFGRLSRNFYTTSSCGICGKSSIDALYAGAKKIYDRLNPRLDSDFIYRLPGLARVSQCVFERTGGLHASTLFNADGEIDILREDVGRHNALDKVIGAKFLAGHMLLSDAVLLVSGRASFELVQKALVAGIPILAAVGAPSSLAVEFAREFGMTLIGFVRNDRFNIYTGEQRIVIEKGMAV